MSLGFRLLDSQPASFIGESAQASSTILTVGSQRIRIQSIYKGRAAMPTTDAIGEQVIEAVVAGPEGANRLFTISGAANVCIEATRQQRTTETWTFLVGPPLTRLQFHRAIGTASVASQIVSVQNTPREFTVNIHSVEADWDDENQRVNMRVEIGLISNGSTVTITQIRYWVAILAQM
jgi:hypothetical protein